MTENENVIVETEHKKQLGISEDFKKFLIVTFGTFIGFYFALSLFAAVHNPMIKSCHCNKPPVLSQMYYPGINQDFKNQHHYIGKKHHKKCHKHDFKNKQFNKINEKFSGKE